jgi:hypothetical protein
LKYLAEKGADFTIKDKKGRTALKIAHDIVIDKNQKFDKKRHQEVVLFLQSKGAKE